MDDLRFQEGERRVSPPDPVLTTGKHWAALILGACISAHWSWWVAGEAE